ncbi:tetratricopeptide repeat protein [Rubinisphaera italica]|uniref:Lipoprotein NlpI n=1 Tax=Rubinisphaera italica TaxID=2527969 RepID=A0A5C5XMB7_9PLAN|nr:tetratricopeptide repeat protein [Rubinisphaera italica]TWT64100.1 lipoprotein NlpI [Rubinisphaera italica]
MLEKWTTLVITMAALGISGCTNGEDNPMVGRHKALIAYQEGDYERAIKLREEVLEKHPDYPFLWEVLYEQGVAYLDMDQPEKALPYFDRTIEIDPEYNFAYIRRAECYDMLGNFEAALADGNKALEVSRISSEFADLFLTRGNAYSQNGEQEMAAQNWEVGLKISPGMVPLLYRLSGFYLRTDRVEEALELIDRSLEVENQDPEVNLMRTIALARLDRMDEAEEALMRTQKVNTENQDNHIEVPASLQELMQNIQGARTSAEIPQAPMPLPEVVDSQSQQKQAFEVSRKYLISQGYQCEEKPEENLQFISCKLDDESYSIRVKSVADAQADSFGLTDAELEEMMQQSPPAGLIVVTGIDAATPEAQRNPTGRVAAFTKSWRPDPTRLSPIAYRYPLPKPEE